MNLMCACGALHEIMYGQVTSLRYMDCHREVHRDFHASMPGWHLFLDYKYRKLKWVAPHKHEVVEEWEAWRGTPPPEPETEMDRYFREHPDASTD